MGDAARFKGEISHYESIVRALKIRLKDILTNISFRREPLLMILQIILDMRMLEKIQGSQSIQ